jgi:hypothetical protein
MSIQTDLPVFERAVEARGRLLRVEADRSGTKPRQLVMTFDVGRVLIRPTDDGLSAELIEDRAALPEGLTAIDEGEPWWRVLGQPLTAAWPGGIEESAGAHASGPLLALKLRFREEAENPRIVLLESAGTAVRVSLEG